MIQGGSRCSARRTAYNIPVSGVQWEVEAVFGVSTPEVGPGEFALVTGTS